MRKWLANGESMSEWCSEVVGNGGAGSLGPLLDAEAFAAGQDALGEGDGEARALRYRRAMARTALELSGEVGYERMTVAALITRGGSNRDRFYRSFGSKESCWFEAYRAGSEEIAARLLAAGAAGASWAEGMEAALGELAAFLEAEPLIAKGLITEVFVAGPAALNQRKEVFERLSRAIDLARRETSTSRHSPPPITADFILSGIETAVRKCLLIGLRDFRGQVPDFLAFSSLLYFGPVGARRGTRRAQPRRGPSGDRQ